MGGTIRPSGGRFEPSRLGATIWTRPPRSCISAPSLERSSSRAWFCFVCPSPLERTRRAAKGERPLVQIFVRDNNVDQALKALKKKMQREGSFREMKRHVHFEKPSEKRARQKAEAVRRARKLARKRAQREGLLPAPKGRGR
ncbi:MAG: 30S ribosomal protein S21 [Bordetella sp.]|nr:30S ribosomal protein S21 [Bordetella sp.]